MRSTLTLAVALIALLACASPQLERRMYSTRDSTSRSMPGPAAREEAARLGQVPNALSTVVASQAAARDLIPLGAPGATPNMVIRSGHASVEVDSLEPAIALVRELASRVGGYVANTTMQRGGDQLRSASLEVKIPAERFDEALSGIVPIGKLESVPVSAQDVGEEFVDVTARMSNARRLETRLVDLLVTRTGRLKDVLDVEQQLARVREEIERYEGRLRYLQTHAPASSCRSARLGALAWVTARRAVPRLGGRQPAETTASQSIR